MLHFVARGSRATPALCGPGDRDLESTRQDRVAGVPVDRCTDRAPLAARTRCGIGIPSTTWTTEQRFASSSPLAAPASPPTRSASRRSAPGACPGFDAARSRPSPGSASSTTPVSSEDRSPVPLLVSSRPSPGHSSSTKPNERTSSTSPAPPTASPPRAAPAVEPRASPRHDPASTGRWKRSRTASPSSETLTRTCSPPTPSAERFTPRWSARVAGSPTWPGSSSSTPPPATSTPTGTCSPRCAWASCAPKPAATPTTAACKA